MSRFLCLLCMGCVAEGPASVVAPSTPTPTSATEPAPPTESAADPEVSVVELEHDVRSLAVERSWGSPGWQAAQDRCVERFESLGFDVELHDFAEGTNVLGRKRGSGSGVVVVGAHYDGVPNCAGADDNASGVGGLLELARVMEPVELEPDLLFACWDQEEAGLLGSSAWVAATDETVLEAWSLEMIGFTSSAPNSQTLPFGIDLVFPEQAARVQANDNRGDFITFVADTPMAPAATTYASHADAIGLPMVPLLLNRGLVDSPLTGELKRSDHAPFWAAGIPAVMVTDSANFRNRAYHCDEGEDTVDRLDFDFAADVIRTLAATLESQYGS